MEATKGGVVRVTVQKIEEREGVRTVTLRVASADSVSEVPWLREGDSVAVTVWGAFRIPPLVPYKDRGREEGILTTLKEGRSVWVVDPHLENTIVPLMRDLEREGITYGMNVTQEPFERYIDWGPRSFVEWLLRRPKIPPLKESGIHRTYTFYPKKESENGSN